MSRPTWVRESDRYPDATSLEGSSDLGLAVEAMNEWLVISCPDRALTARRAMCDARAGGARAGRLPRAIPGVLRDRLKPNDDEGRT